VKRSQSTQVPVARRRSLRVRCIWPLALALAALLSVAGVAQAAEPVGKRVTIEGAPAPGPKRLDKVFLRKYGPSDAKTILILTPGSPGSQGNYARLAPWLVQRVPGLAVWAVDRRSNALEDISVFERDDAMSSLEYYLLGERVGGRTFKPVTERQAPYIRKWGAEVVMNDLHRVVHAAGRQGRSVILGGHSAGAVTVPAYATWNFHGHPGYKELAGMLQIDGAEFGAFDAYLKGTAYYPPYLTKRDAKRGLAKHDRQSAFGIAGAPLPVPLWTVGVLPEISCQFAIEDPQGTSVLQSVIPPSLRKEIGLPREAITNEAFMGVYTTNGLASAFQMRTGRLAITGSPRPWVNGPFSSVPSVCKTFTQEPGNGLEWYYPARLDVDLFQAMPTLEPTGATRYLGLHPRYLHDVDIPLYAFQTSISDGGVLRGTEKFIAKSKVRSHWLYQDLQMGHFDPLEDFPARNRFIQTVTPWLRDLVAGEDPGSRGLPVG
jgi:pimeloyl-ACP methyl ester carboxylesterase